MQIFLKAAIQFGCTLNQQTKNNIDRQYCAGLEAGRPQSAGDENTCLHAATDHNNLKGYVK